MGWSNRIKATHYKAACRIIEGQMNSNPPHAQDVSSSAMILSSFKRKALHCLCSMMPCRTSRIIGLREVPNPKRTPRLHPRSLRTSKSCGVKNSNRNAYINIVGGLLSLGWSGEPTSYNIACLPYRRKRIAPSLLTAP